MSSYNGYNFTCGNGQCGETPKQHPKGFDDMFDSGVYRTGKSTFQRRGNVLYPRGNTHYTRYIDANRDNTSLQSLDQHNRYMR